MEKNDILMEEVNVGVSPAIYGPGSPGVACGADCTGIGCAVGGGGACGGACNGLVCGFDC